MMNWLHDTIILVTCLSFSCKLHYDMTVLFFMTIIILFWLDIPNTYFSLPRSFDGVGSDKLTSSIGKSSVVYITSGSLR